MNIEFDCDRSEQFLDHVAVAECAGELDGSAVGRTEFGVGFDGERLVEGREEVGDLDRPRTESGCVR